MKRWWGNVVKDYLTFSKRERNGLLIALIVFVCVFLFFRYYPVSKPEVKKDAFQQELAHLKISIDSSKDYSRYERDDNVDYYQPKHNDYNNYAKGETFAFDPNTLDADGWKRLGIREKTVHTIQNFLAKGYKFRQPEDIRKIFGLRKEDADRLVPYVRIEGQSQPANTFTAVNNIPATPKPAYEVNRNRTVEINSADTGAFIALPGIGSKLAARIVAFRDRLGGFSSVNQLAETYGLPDSTFQRVRQRLQCNVQAVKKINVNTADVNQLRVHPYLRWNIANAIVNYRNQHGNYKSIEDLRKIDIITDDLFNKISPYLVL